MPILTVIEWGFKMYIKLKEMDGASFYFSDESVGSILEEVS